MVIARTVAELRAAQRETQHGLAERDSEDYPLLGFVPTMGALHEGHRSLLRRARAECAAVAASIFVNPLQFAPGEDLAHYPRSFEADCDLLEAEGVDILFAPTPETMYPGGHVTVIHVAGLEDRLDGASRPGHFAGVATVVAKLFHIVQPTRAYFGQKDAAQLAVLRAMVSDLDFDLEIVACPIVRDANGLALSSRNRYLSAEEREQALMLPRILISLTERIAGGERDTNVLLREARAQLTGSVALDYLAIVGPTTLLPVEAAAPGSLIAIAAKVGSTRLIDNMLAP